MTKPNAELSGTTDSSRDGSPDPADPAPADSKRTGTEADAAQVDQSAAPDTLADIVWLLDSALEAVALFDEGEIAFANDAFVSLFGFPSRQWVFDRRSPSQLFDVRLEALLAHELEKLSAHTPVTRELETTRHDGSSVRLQVRTGKASYQGRQLSFLLASDLTDYRDVQSELSELQARLSVLMESASCAVFVLDVDTGLFVDANQSAVRMFGHSRSDLIESGLVNLTIQNSTEASSAEDAPTEDPPTGDPLAEVTQHLRNALAGRRVTFEWNVCNSRGRVFPVEVRLFQMPARDLRLVRVELTDISDRLRAERALIEKTLLLESTFENIDEGICLIDAQLNVLTYNRRLLTLLDIDDESFEPGVPVERFIRHLAERGDYGPGDVHEQVQQRLDDIATFRAHEFRRARPNGRIIETRGRPMPGGGVVRTYRDVTATHILAEQLSRQARFDALTGLLNRWEFERRLRQVLEAEPSDIGHVLCYLDLDQFKVINDTCGHDAGDELLRRLGEALPRSVRTRDSLARLGGDEFGILLEDCSLAQAQAVADEVRQAIEDFQFAWNETVFRIGVSIGVVEISKRFQEVGEVLKAADAACYAAKDRGRNRVQIYREDDVDIARRHGEMQWVARIDRALAENRFQLYAQPIVNLAASAHESALRSCSFEVLLRMVNEEKRLVPPGAFLPAAERFGLSARLDRWVVGEAMRWLAELGTRIDAIGFCSINLSGQSLGDEELMAGIQAALKHVPAEKVCFEITETAAMQNFANARQFIETLRGQGCHFALDDFGSGLSSFGYLKSLPVDIVKIDGNFVKDIVDDEVDRAFVRSINEVGHIMGKKTIAEFVENDALVRELIDIEVDYGQGYGLGRPVPIDEILPS